MDGEKEEEGDGWLSKATVMNWVKTVQCFAMNWSSAVRLCVLLTAVIHMVARQGLVKKLEPRHGRLCFFDLEKIFAPTPPSFDVYLFGGWIKIMVFMFN